MPRNTNNPPPEPSPGWRPKGGRDLDLSRHAQASLLESEERFRSAFDHTGVAMVLTDLDHRFLRVNAAFARLFGYSQAELLQLTMIDVTHPDDLAESYSRREDLKSGAVDFFQVEKRYLHKDGHEFWGLANVSLVRDAAGQPLQYVGQVQDITERKKAESANARYVERLKILHQIDRALIEGEGPAAIAGAALVPLRKLLGVPRVIVNLFDLAKGEVEWLAAAGRRRVHVGPGVRYSIRLMGDVEALKRGEMQTIDVHALPPGPEVDALLASGVHAYAVVPMIAGGELIGALSLGGASLPLSEEQIGIAREVGAQFAITLAQARLHERITHQARELELRLAERLRAEEALGQTRQRLEHVVATSPAVLYTLTSRAGVFQLSWISENVREMLGDASEEVLTRSWWRDHVHPDDVPRVGADLLHHLLAENRLVEEYRLRHRDGRYRWVRSELRLVRDASGAPAEIVGSWSDITELKNLEDQVRQAQKMEAIGRLAGGVAHDFNNLLTVINGYGELLLEKLPGDDPSRELIRGMVSAGDRAAGLTRQLLAFSRKAIVEPRVLNLKGVVADVNRLLHRIIGEDVQLNVVVDPEAGAIKADAGQVEQVIVNLVVNARDAMPQGGQLTIEVRNAQLDETYAQRHPDVRPGSYVLLAVADTGCGMDRGTMARVFEPFFSTKGEQGTGLGLATVYGIVQQCGGHITVASEVGRGATFEVYFPRVREGSPVGKPPSEQTAIPQGSETLLLVEDEDGVRALACHVLRSCGYNLLEARDGAEAVRVGEQHQGRIDLLVTDVVMPRMSGREVAERLAKAHPEMKVLFLSGYTDDAVVRHGVMEAEVSFLQKPFAMAALAHKVRDVLERSAAG